MNNQTNSQNQNIDYLTLNDKLHVEIKEACSQIDSYEQWLHSVDNGLRQAQNSLSGVMGMENVLGAIQQSYQENNSRIKALQQMRQDQFAFFQAINNSYLQFKQEIDNLPKPNANAPLQISQNMTDQNSNVAPH